MYSQILHKGSCDIVISASFCIVRQMQRNTEIKTEHKNIHIITNPTPVPKAICFGNVFSSSCELGRASSLRISHTFPASRKVAPQKLLKIRNGILHLPQNGKYPLVEVRIAAFCRMVSARADATYRKSADAVGTTHIELFAVRGYRCITVGEESAKATREAILLFLSIFHKWRNSVFSFTNCAKGTFSKRLSSLLKD